MNIIDAAKSGKPFKRGAYRWMKFQGAAGLTFLDGVAPNPEITRADILANDWKLKETAVQVTKTELNDAFNTAWLTTRPTEPPAVDVRDRLAAELAL